MDILKHSALVYKEMLNKEYLIIGGKNGSLFSNILQFTAEEFKHCIGLHKLKDIPTIYRSSSAALFHQILNDKLTIDNIRNSVKFHQIKKRIENFIYIEDYLDNAMVYYDWYQQKSPYSNIEASIMIPINKSVAENQSTYIFFKHIKNQIMNLSECIIEEAAVNATVTTIIDKRDYTKGQPRPPVMMYKEKINRSTGEHIILYDKLTTQHNNL